jgi:hypothetical protein
VVHVNKPKDNFTKPDLDRVFQTLWDEDDLAFTSEYYRVCFTLIVLLNCETGARLSAFFKGWTNDQIGLESVGPTVGP